MLKFKLIGLLSVIILAVSLAACSSTVVQPKVGIIKSELGYEDAYNKILVGSQKCYPDIIIDHEIYTYKPIAEISISGNPSTSLSFVAGTPIVEGYRGMGVFKATINGLANKTSSIEISDDVYVPTIQNWLHANYICKQSH